MTDGRLTIDAQPAGGGNLLVLEGEVDPHTTGSSWTRPWARPWPPEPSWCWSSAG